MTRSDLQIRNFQTKFTATRAEDENGDLSIEGYFSVTGQYLDNV